MGSAPMAAGVPFGALPSRSPLADELLLLLLVSVLLLLSPFKLLSGTVHGNAGVEDFCGGRQIETKIQ